MQQERKKQETLAATLSFIFLITRLLIATEENLQLHSISVLAEGIKWALAIHVGDALISFIQLYVHTAIF